ncbi:AraC family transcriptional regulator [Chroococcidiopsis sp. SAG 2025]|uniref:helix-turn-helix transcriptional regulator n=1 Tax=Chroococcidiopsis sp. SAG 2025 TaxID=171389 RepID=UPI002936DA49|nr:AraC family transcriptional regulator [Chroococcidiopsis sp. SAG 2025]
MESLTEVEFDEWCHETLVKEETYCDRNGFDLISRRQHSFGEHFTRLVEFPSRLELEIWEGNIYRDESVLGQHEELMPLVSKFYLSGNHHVLTPGIKEIPDDYVESGGQHYLFYLPNIDEIEQWSAGDRVKQIRIQFPLDWLRTHCQELDSLPIALRSLLERANPPRFHQSGRGITLAMLRVLQQIDDAPYAGAIKRIYLESKVLELLALQFNQLAENERAIHPLSSLKPIEVDRVYQARDILIGQLDNPPSLLDLARMVGLSDRKLRRGFREIFGTTVFGYLHDYRMEQARLLLCVNKMRVADVAQTVGYSHLGHFIASFKRKFGITPKECRMGKKPIAAFGI